jgi:L-alanine-DL-glutamate epimerase-like enolase superfamily enzyme
MNTTNEYSGIEKKIKITDIKAMQIKGSAGQSLVKVETDAGVFGIGEAGASGPTIRAQIQQMKWLWHGEDPLNIEKLYYRMISIANRVSPYRAHIPTISGIDIALWDIAGKVLNRPICDLLTGRVRDGAPIYINSGCNFADKVSCRDWASQLKESPYGWHTVKVGAFGAGLTGRRRLKLKESPVTWERLTAGDLHTLQGWFENCREALGYDMDFIVHCHDEFDLPSALGLAQAVASSDPLWIEDPLPVEYSDSWKTLADKSPVRILTGEKLELAREFLPFLANQAVHAVQPDLAFAGGITGAKKISDLAMLYHIPMTAHNVGTAVLNMATAHFGISTRNFLMMETRISQYDIIDKMVEEPIQVVNGQIIVPDRPGLGITLIPEVLHANLEEGEPYWE